MYIYIDKLRYSTSITKDYLQQGLQNSVVLSLWNQKPRSLQCV
jgi:hypothetical protein